MVPRKERTKQRKIKRARERGWFWSLDDNNVLYIVLYTLTLLPMMPRPGTQALVVSRADKIYISALLASSLVRNNIFCLHSTTNNNTACLKQISLFWGGLGKNHPSPYRMTKYWAKASKIDTNKLHDLEPKELGNRKSLIQIVSTIYMSMAFTDFQRPCRKRKTVADATVRLSLIHIWRCRRS